ncbi:ras-related and estrogen-regulated growth inhibitor-like isoform X1 [Vidua macroura]|uniref:ras-related and estrogen-regulated growth inhibitor-like isoform X1 n=1 Tax=Vidua macroura TaxID=187451 RepID=UPI0023A825CA|nr:ras-related and estrogen-regulated growth inhibitor-like isoform X1 [Vidua macroura]XP_053835332.1 ras-related and estrogen-regulated growth inhibitor-like isoform X1 [Vidua macroura]XP_053835333.1 ras-related and estrogen-regulated growth inhibitor-like isoform X1 [Vidua macroura]XP_053835334.1 ras-related and estrogen-regulated growth inhibitor-like isoform X1 [Vidua macroura]XP_053835335.1 ras-related and estrogen-regulated growth inhibitor-like isoform X1 [Vidua macroura]XP_053835336.1 
MEKQLGSVSLCLVLDVNAEVSQQDWCQKEQSEPRKGCDSWEPLAWFPEQTPCVLEDWQAWKSLTTNISPGHNISCTFPTRLCCGAPEVDHAVITALVSPGICVPRVRSVLGSDGKSQDAAQGVARLVRSSQDAQGTSMPAPALTVRFITRRFIGDYDPTLEMIYRHVAVIDGEMVHFEILDTAGQEEDSLQIEEKIKWGDGFAVVYSVTDRCSFDEVMRLCFLINHLHASPKRSGAAEQPPVVIVGNKKDLQFDRMVSTEDGENLSKALKIPFYEISTRDSYEEPVAVFSSLYQELLRQGHFSPGSFKRRTVSKLMEKIPKMQASSTLNSAGRSLSFNSFRDYIPE